MPIYDFSCPAGDGVFEARSSYVDGAVLPQPCPECGKPGGRVWLKAPGVFGDENVSKELLAAAKSGLTLRTGTRNIEPFVGSTRSELRAWERRNGLVPVEDGERLSRHTEINAKTKFTETTEFKRAHDEVMRDAFEAARSGDEGVRKALAEIDEPNDYDREAFRVQAEAGIVAKPELVSIAEEIAPTTA